MSSGADFNQRDPFADFINATLNLEGIDGITLETVTAAMREVIQNLPPADGEELWPDALNHLQRTLRTSLAVETVSNLLQRHPQFGVMDANDLDMLVNLVISLSFACYNDLHSRFDYADANVAALQQQNRLLWTTLFSTVGYVRKAAREGDQVAAHLNEDVKQLLQDNKPNDWNDATLTWNID